MAKVPRLNKVILPQLSDPANIGRQVDPGAFAAAGGVARGIGQAAEVALAFKEAKDASFVAEKSTLLERDVDTFFRDFQVDAASDPDARKPEFDKFIGKRFDVLAKDASPAALREFSKFRDDIRFKYDGKYTNFARTQNVKNFAKSFDNTISDTAELAFRAGQDGSPDVNDFLNNVDMASVAGSTFIGAPDLANLNAEGKSIVAQEYAQGRIENNPKLFKEELDDGVFDSVLTVDQIQSLGKIADAELKDVENEAQKLATRQKNELESTIGLQITTSENLADIEKAAQRAEQSEDILGVISSNKLKAQIFAKRNKLAKEIDLISIGARFASGEAQLNPQDADAKKAYNAFYKDLAPTLAELPPEVQNAAKAKIIDNAKHVPDIIKGEISLAARSQNPEELVNAADFIDRVTSINPHLLRDLGSETELARIKMVNQRIDAGLPPRDAIENTDKILDPRNAPTEEAVQSEIKTIRKNFDYRKKAVENFESFLPFGIADPETQGTFITPELDGMTARYRIAFEDHYRLTRDKDVAEDYADKVIRGQYANTTINGFKQIMQFGPEPYYSIAGEKNDWMRDQMLEEAFKATRNTIPLPSKKELKKNLRLVVDPRVTPRSAAAGEPLYKLFWVREDAPVDVLQGKFFKFDPDERRKQLIENAK